MLKQLSDDLIYPQDVFDIPRHEPCQLFIITLYHQSHGLCQLIENALHAAYAKITLSSLHLAVVVELNLLLALGRRQYRDIPQLKQLFKVILSQHVYILDHTRYRRSIYVESVPNIVLFPAAFKFIRTQRKSYVEIVNLKLLESTLQIHMNLSRLLEFGCLLSLRFLRNRIFRINKLGRIKKPFLRLCAIHYL